MPQSEACLGSVAVLEFPMADDDVLLEEIRTGNERAFTDLLNQYKAPLYSYLLLHNPRDYRLVGHFQKIFLDLIPASRKRALRGNFPNWLYRQARSLSAGYATAIEAEEGTIERSLADLATEERELIFLRHQLNTPWDQVAQILNRPISDLKKTYQETFYKIQPNPRRGTQLEGLCLEFDQELIGYLYSEMETERRLRYQKHMGGCFSCQPWVRTYQNLLIKLDVLILEEPPESVLTNIKNLAPDQLAGNKKKGIGRYVAGATVLTAVIALLIFWLKNEDTPGAMVENKTSMPAPSGIREPSEAVPALKTSPLKKEDPFIPPFSVMSGPIKKNKRPEENKTSTNTPQEQVKPSQPVNALAAGIKKPAAAPAVASEASLPPLVVPPSPPLKEGPPPLLKKSIEASEGLEAPKRSPARKEELVAVMDLGEKKENHGEFIEAVDMENPDGPPPGPMILATTFSPPVSTIKLKNLKLTKRSYVTPNRQAKMITCHTEDGDVPLFGSDKADASEELIFLDLGFGVWVLLSESQAAALDEWNEGSHEVVVEEVSDIEEVEVSGSEPRHGDPSDVDPNEDSSPSERRGTALGSDQQGGDQKDSDRPDPGSRLQVKGSRQVSSFKKNGAKPFSPVPLVSPDEVIYDYEDPGLEYPTSSHEPKELPVLECCVREKR